MSEERKLNLVDLITVLSLFVFLNPDMTWPQLGSLFLVYSLFAFESFQKRFFEKRNEREVKRIEKIESEMRELIATSELRKLR